MSDSSTGRTQSILITGASTGIGEACALRMASRGWRVFAGVRREHDGEALRAKSSSIVPILLDVTNQDRISDAVARVGEIVGVDGLQAVLNNAGVAMGGPLECLPMQDLRAMFDVNVFGPVAMTQAFVPILRASRGRLLFTGSNSGFWCEPYMAMYGATKHALEAICDSLRVELAPWGINVVLIEPGMIKTPIWDKAREAHDRAPQTISAEGLKLYEKPIAALRPAIDLGQKLAADPDRVARAVQHALESRRPRTRYRVGIDSRLQYRLRTVLPDCLRDWVGRKLIGL